MGKVDAIGKITSNTYLDNHIYAKGATTLHVVFLILSISEPEECPGGKTHSTTDQKPHLNIVKTA